MSANAHHLSAAVPSLAEQLAVLGPPGKYKPSQTTARCAVKVRVTVQKEIRKLSYFSLSPIPLFSVLEGEECQYCYEAQSSLRLLQLADGERKLSQTLRACLS